MTTLSLTLSGCSVCALSSFAIRALSLGARAARPRLAARLAALSRPRPRQIVTMLDILERKYVGAK